MPIASENSLGIKITNYFVKETSQTKIRIAAQSRTIQSIRANAHKVSNG